MLRRDILQAAAALTVLPTASALAIDPYADYHVFSIQFPYEEKMVLRESHLGGEGPLSSGIIKLFLRGKLSAISGDRRLKLRIDERATGYVNTGFTAPIVRSESRIVESPPDYFFLGRNEDGQDATFFVEVTLSKLPRAEKILLAAEWLFSDVARPLKGTTTGSLQHVDPIKTISIEFDKPSQVDGYCDILTLRT